MKKYQRAIGSRKSKSNSNLNKTNETKEHMAITEIIVDPRKSNDISKDITCRSSGNSHQSFNKFEFIEHNGKFFSKR